MPRYDREISIYIASEVAIPWAVQVTRRPEEDIRKALAEADAADITCVITENYPGEFDRTVPPLVRDIKMYRL